MAASSFRFGEYRLDTAARELWAGERMVALPPKSFGCIAYLIEHRERAVGRDELISAVWGRVDVSDDVLAQALLRARRAVGDTGNEQRAIRTVPRFGYRWILPLDTPADPPPSIAADVAAALPAGDATAADIAAVATKTRLPRYTRWAALAVLVLAVGLLAWSLARQPATPRAAVRSDSLLLVLPVAVGGAGPDFAWMRLGAMDYLASRLRTQARRKVLPSEQTLLLIGQDAGPTDAGALHRLELASGASYILAPQATLSGDAWNFVIDVYHDGGVHSYTARAGNPLDAAGLTLARFIGSIGASGNDGDGKVSAATERVQRIDAAMLAGDLASARQLADSAPAALNDDPAIVVRAAQIAFRAGQLEAAERQFRPLAENAVLAVDVRAQAQMGLGAVAVRRQDFAAAERDYSAAIATLAGAAGQDHPDLLGSAYSSRGVANGARGRFDAALADFGRARVELERAGDHVEIGSVEVNFALVEASRGRYGEAVAAFDRAIATFSRFDVRDNLAAALLGKTRAQLALLDHEGALSSSASAFDLSAHLENPILKQDIAEVRIRTVLMAGQLDAATGLLDAAQASSTDPEFALLRAHLQLERGDAAAAVATATKVLDSLGTGAGPASGAAVSEVAMIAATAGRRVDAGSLLDRVREQLQATPDAGGERDAALPMELASAVALAAHGDATADAHFSAAISAADRSGSADSLVSVGIGYAAYLIQQHALDQATTVVGRLSPYADRDYRAARATAALYHALGNADLAASAEAKVQRLAGERRAELPL
ncbi:MAG TPA: winged helix-turn-helix domain-containing protein [Dokdonella sp.]